MNIVIFGPPGAGKGTQANNLVKEFNLNKVSTGDLLRKEIKKKTKLGIDIENIINKGNLVSDEIINNLLENISSKKENHNRLIFDGYPRKLSQVKNLDKMLNKHNQKISCVLSLNVNLDIVIKRILGREICSKCGLTFNKFFKRISKRLENFHNEFKNLNITREFNDIKKLEIWDYKPLNETKRIAGIIKKRIIEK